MTILESVTTGRNLIEGCGQHYCPKGYTNKWGQLTQVMPIDRRLIYRISIPSG
jgi:hypothetical protein